MKHSHGSLTTVCGPLLALGLHLVVHNMILVVTWFHIQWWCVTTTTTTTTLWPIICLFYNCSFIKCNFKSSCCFPPRLGAGGFGGGAASPDVSSLEQLVCFPSRPSRLLLYKQRLCPRTKNILHTHTGTDNRPKQPEQTAGPPPSPPHPPCLPPTPLPAMFLQPKITEKKGAGAEEEALTVWGFRNEEDDVYMWGKTLSCPPAVFLGDVTKVSTNHCETK